METEKQTETEQLEDKTEEVETDKQAEEEAQKQAEEEAEILSEIAEYKAKIEALDEKIAEYAAKKVDDLKRELMSKWHYTNEQIDHYIKFVDGKTAEEIERSIAELAQDIPPAGDNFADPSPMNGIKQKPAAADPSEIGKSLFERIKHRIWGGGATL